MSDSTSIVLAGQADSFMPVMSIEQAVDRHNAVVKFAQTVMREGLDYGVIPGTERKTNNNTPNHKNNTLLKPGAEKLCTLFGLVPEFEDYRVSEDWDKGFFYYAFRCTLSRNGRHVGSGIGSCNSREKKYRRVQRCCPSCGASTLKRSKYPPRGKPRTDPGGWFCDTKGGGCGDEFAHDDPAVMAKAATVDPAESADLVNTIQKMAQKRALVAATLVATSASEFFTQDVEDMDIIDGDWKPTAPPSAKPPQTTAAPKVETINEETGEVIGHDAAEVATDEQLKELKDLLATAGDPKKVLAATEYIYKAEKVGSLSALTADQAFDWIGRLKKKAAEKSKQAVEQAA